jgi:triosephosphate isomerase (TIM)
VSFTILECKEFFMLRPKIITGNWKMYKTIEQTADFIKAIAPLVADNPFEIFLAVPFTAIQTAAQAAEGTKLVIGAQNMNDATEGAFTGEIAANMLKDAGAEFVLLGHSERRRYFHEDDALINLKIKRALSIDLRPVLCVGETLAEREDDKTQEAVKRQITQGLADLSARELKNLILAYEPVWAIGSGLYATPEEAEEMHQFCRQVLSELFDPDFASTIPIQYGGSVNALNAKVLMEQADVDGLLVGGASLSLESFSHIIHNSESTPDEGIL